MTVRELLAEAAISIATRDAELLLAQEVGRDRSWLYAHDQDKIETELAASFRAKVTRRASSEPLQYIVGEQEFFGRPFYVTSAVLIPRPETEHLVTGVLEWVAHKAGLLRVADVGTGSGAIAISLAKELKEVEIYAIDISSDALKVAGSNAVRHGVDKCIQFLEANLLAEVAGKLDIVVSNPPYIPAGDALAMQREVVEHEPHLALFAGEEGLDVYSRLIPEAAVKLRDGGLLAMEIGFGQKEALEQLLANWNNVRFISDYAGIPRVVLAETAS